METKPGSELGLQLTKQSRINERQKQEDLKTSDEGKNEWQEQAVDVLRSKTTQAAVDVTDCQDKIYDAFKT